jgi:hypothetical protein
MLTVALLLALPPEVGSVARSIDTVAVIAAAWATSAADHRGLRATVLAAPALPGSWRRVGGLAPALRARGVPVRTDTAAVGPDTVVYQVLGLEPAAAGGMRVLLQSAWERRVGRCAYRSGNTETIVVRRVRGRYRGELTRPVGHGDSVCRPVPSPEERDTQTPTAPAP